MSVQSANIFALLDEDGDETPRAKSTAPKAAAEKPKPAPAAAAKPAEKKQEKPKQEKKPPIDQPRDTGKGGKGGKGGGKGTPREDRPPRQGGSGDIDTPRDYSGKGEGGRGGKGGRGKGGPVREGKREYDRRSGTGKGDGRGNEVKKGGAGKANWGTDTGAEQIEAEKPKEGAEEPVEEPVEEEEKEPEVKEFSYEEYLAMQAAKKCTIATPSARQVDEKAVDKKWQSAVRVNKGEEENYFQVDSKNSGPKDKKKGGNKKVDMSAELMGAPPPRPRETEDRFDGGKGGKGKGGKGKGGKGDAGKGAGGKANTPRRNNEPMPANSEENFPALG